MDYIQSRNFVKNSSEVKTKLHYIQILILRELIVYFQIFHHYPFLTLELKKNYVLLNYSTIEINLQIQKIISYPLYLILMTLFSGALMFGIKYYKSNTFKISIGLFLCVLIYYFNNLFNALGTTEKMNYILSVWLPLIILSFITTVMLFKINEK